MKRLISIILCVMMIFTGAEVFAAPEDVILIDDESDVEYQTPKGPDAGVAAGFYYIYPKCSSSKVLTVKDGSKQAGANVYLFQYGAKIKQQFYISPQGDGTYCIKNARSGLALETKNGAITNYANVQQGRYRKLAYQKWYIIKSGSYYVFQNAASSRVLSIDSSQDANRANALLYNYKQTDGQRFKLKAVKKTTPSDDYEEISEYKTSTRKWSDSKDYPIMANIIGAVESGGQVYGNRDYAAYADPYASTSNEVTITIGWAQCYGYEAQELINRIYKMSASKFKAIDKNGLIVEALKHDWVATKWKPSDAEKKVIISLITSENGKKAQDQQFAESMESFVSACKSQYTSNAWAIHMYCEIRHLGGQGAAKRIFDRCSGDYSLDSIMSALMMDQENGNGAEVGDAMFESRHRKVCEFLQKYAV
ncbi:MAG: RICIN domain-containing protein [Lachnospiraceae bacterium]|nr:RICIN domain-containing protein [Lachnospiraceae bacterium]